MTFTFVAPGIGKDKIIADRFAVTRTTVDVEALPRLNTAQ